MLIETDERSMKKLLILLITIGIGLVVIPSLPTTTAGPKAEDDFTLVQVADGVYAAIAKPGGLASGNAGFIIGDDGVLVFDTFFTPAPVSEQFETLESKR